MTGDRIAEVYFRDCFSKRAQDILRDRVHWMCDAARGLSVLDVGCSQGIAVLLLARRGLDATGIDPNPEAIAYAEGLMAKEPEEVASRMHFVLGEAMSHDFGEKRFDTVLLGEMLEHLDAPWDMLERCVSLLRPGGTVVVSIPMGLHPHEDHKTIFTLSNFVSMIEACCRIETLDVVGGYIRCIGVEGKEKNIDGHPDILRLTEQALVAFQGMHYEAMNSALAQRQQLRERRDAFKQERDRLRKERTSLREERLRMCRQRDLLNKKLEKEQKDVATLTEQASQQRSELERRCDQTAAAMEKLKRTCRLKDKRIHHLEERIHILRESISFRLGNALINAVASPGRNTLTLPATLWGIVRDHIATGRDTACRVQPKNNTHHNSTGWMSFENIQEAWYRASGVFTCPQVCAKAGLLLVDIGIKPERALAASMGLQLSSTNGLFKYIASRGDGRFDLEFKVPPGRTHIRLAVRSWNNSGLICHPEAVSLEPLRGLDAPVEAERILAQVLDLQDAQGVLNVLETEDLGNGQRAFILCACVDKNELLSATDANLLLDAAWRADPEEATARESLRLALVHKDICLPAAMEALLLDLAERIPQHVPLTLKYFNCSGQFSACERLLPVLPLEELGKLGMLIKGRCDLFREGFDLSAVSRISKPQPRKVGYLLYYSLPRNSGGYATRGHEILSALKGQGWDALGITRQGFPWDVRSLTCNTGVDVDTVDGISYHRLPGQGLGDMPIRDYLTLYARNALDFAVDHDLEIIHAASNYINGLVAAHVGHSLGIPSIYEVRGLWEVTRLSNQPGWENSDEYRMLVELETQACLQVDAVVAITESLKQELMHRGVPGEKISVIPNGVDTRRFQPMEPDEDIQQQYGLKGKVVIGFMGSMVQYEGLDDLLRAVALLVQRGVGNHHTLLVGGGKCVPMLRALSRTLGIEDHVTFTGRVPYEDVARHYSVVDIAPFPRKGLPVCELVSPLKPFEAFAMRKTVVASDVAALQEIVSHEETGLLFAKDDPNSLADALERLITDAALREGLAAAGLAWVREHRDWGKLAEGFDTLYRKLTTKD